MCNNSYRCPIGFSGDRCELLDGQSIAWSYNTEVEEVDRETETRDIEKMMLSPFETIAKALIPITCFILMAIIAVVKLSKPQRESNKDENTIVVQDLENSYKMCERVISRSIFAVWVTLFTALSIKCWMFHFQPDPQHQAMDASVPDNRWKPVGDRVTLIENEF